MTPSLAVRPALEAARACPCSRRVWTAFSISPPEVSSAFLHSIIPAPVFSRNSFTKLAEITLICSCLLFPFLSFLLLPYPWLPSRGGERLLPPAYPSGRHGLP